MKKTVALLLFSIFISCSSIPQSPIIAKTPPMGWNSWDCFGVDITEKEVKANADFMAEHLKPFGWEYIVVDLGWYLPPELNTWTFKTDKPIQSIDEYGRLIPDAKKYPSSLDGKGFKPLADYVHSKGLKFGIHIMRGIPWQAVEKNTAILNSDCSAREIVAPLDTCIWYDGMLGINMESPGGLAYYKSLLKLYAQWGVDYVKADDMSSPYHAADIAGIHTAIENCGRPVVLSLSPGETPIEHIDHLLQNANLWRISPDFWDDWSFLYRQFELSKKWQGKAVPGHWPDADMLPLGKLRKTSPDDYVCQTMGLTKEECTDEYSRFSDIEKQTLLSFWIVQRSPLMFGGHLPETDEYTLQLLTNPEAIVVNQASKNNREIYRKDPAILWAADIPNSKDKYAALFNVGDDQNTIVPVTWQSLGLTGTCMVYDLWARKELGEFPIEFGAALPPYGSGLYRISPQ